MKKFLKITLPLIYITIIYLYFHLEITSIINTLFNSDISTSIVFIGVLLLVFIFIYEAFSLLIRGVSIRSIKKIILGIIILLIVVMFFYTTTRFVSNTFSIDECPPELYGTCD